LCRYIEGLQELLDAGDITQAVHDRRAEEALARFRAGSAGSAAA
jgi:hypothetical protein